MEWSPEFYEAIGDALAREAASRAEASCYCHGGGGGTMLPPAALKTLNLPHPTPLEPCEALHVVRDVFGIKSPDPGRTRGSPAAIAASTFATSATRSCVNTVADGKFDVFAIDPYQHFSRPP